MKYSYSLVPVLLSCALALFSACGSSSSLTKNCTAVPQESDCIRPGMKDVRVRWGEWNDSTDVLTGYEFDTQGRLYKYSASPHSVKYLRDSIGTISKRSMCFYVDTVRKTFLRIQSLYVHAAAMRYVEYQNPDAQLSLRAVWDSRFQTYGSKEFRAIFDSLSTLVPPRRE